MEIIKIYKLFLDDIAIVLKLVYETGGLNVFDI